MNLLFFQRIPVTALVLLWLAYNLLGWYLAAHQIVWLVGAFVAAIAIAIVRKSNSWLENLLVFGSQTLVVVLVLSASIALIAIWSILFSIFLIPLATTLLADLEMRFSGFSKTYSFWILTFIAISGLAVGEMIDILIFPSIKY
ncbi:MAG: hypothetical protein ACKO9I_09590 [Sphaerospermopsis kisseleviana]|jgi:hypothetical protein|uniref:Uncharacterized protein n=1 Tax=Sphaerospermopsis reniformis TaxID=531300 RepID=A0A480A3F0_9CYAN|nr:MULTISPECIES: hypothetical protein [Sphaerospermopsis]BAZ79529.1 hypothetical protein NIES73_07730 [Sphaerospermopsis kisseleviana NIES-73]MBC5797740.1 hypothetical protein [Sphaerospermopsis sp. LEGE 00249]MBD2131952.1 hypothetical protein [Sphaerospermopsis sp. FACHB-1094]MBD2146806.1 hypothetical protein [Sphaerospermopsis sp. FACHB-1194]GCL38253.1 hypothetical protein SR1949_33670 [Sphaerospermopsis reniformis]